MDCCCGDVVALHARGAMNSFIYGFYTFFKTFNIFFVENFDKIDNFEIFYLINLFF
jgi:hypothetical protein